MRTDSDQHGSRIPQSKCQLLRDTQFRRRTPPEQIRGSSSNDDNVGLEGSKLGGDVGDRKSEHVRIEQQRLMSCLLEHLLRNSELEREVR